ncbi:MAG: PAS domain S-box protein [Chloroflexi bacterium]|nr:PAS domain S-box protein [Chloroflexota bacterium]MBP7593154.1 PAS domain S-box protein [Chloroflexota bacterium]
MIQNTVHPFILLLFLSGVVALVFAVYSWSRQTAVSRPFAILMFAASFWSFTYGFELLSSDLNAILFWISIEYLGILTVPVALFVFTCRFTGRDSRRTGWPVIVLSIIPAITLLLVWTNRWHALYYTSVYLIERDGLTLIATTRGVAYWVSVAYGYSLVLGSVVLLVLALRGARPPYRGQVLVILAGVIVPWVGNFIFNAFLRQSTFLDLTPITFTFTGVVIAIGLFRHQFLELVPVARNKLVETMEDAWIVVDQADRLVDLNSMAQNIFGLQPEGLVGRPMRQIMADYEAMLDQLTTSPDSQVEIGLDVGGRRRLFDVRQTPLWQDHGRQTGRLIMLRDITGRKVAEKNLQELTNHLEALVVVRTAEIEAEKEKVETVLRSVNEGIALTNVALVIQYVNDEFSRLIGQPQESLVGRSVGEVVLGAAYEPQRVMIDDALWSGRSWQMQMSTAVSLNQPLICEVTAVPVLDANGRLTGAVWTLYDISDLRKLEQARNQFVSNISHEFRTPLSNIKLYVSLMQRQELPPKTIEYVKVLELQLDRLEHLTERILTIARLDSMQALDNPQPVDLRAIISPLLLHFQTEADQKQIKLLVPGGERPFPIVFGSAEYIHKALMEIIQNALNFTPPNGQIRLDITQEPPGPQGWTSISVIDNGPGILPEDQPKIFDRFFRGSLAASGFTPGLGLGLSIAKEIMRLHGGRVTYHCWPGEGCCFTLLWPPKPTAQEGH